MIRIAAPSIGPEEISAVNEVLASGMLAQGPRVAALEEAFAAYCGTKYAVAVNSGTAAIHAALYAAGIGPGDEVITTPFSFMASINPILLLGAKPVLVDISPKTFNIDVSKIEQAITPKTKAIIPVHLFGQPVNVAKLQAIATKHNLIIVEDACQAIGALHGKAKAGSFGDLGCFSLYATKNIMSGEGGMVTTDSKAYAAAMKRFRQHGMSDTYEYVDIGYNYRMTDLHAAIAHEQLKKVEDFNAARAKNAQLLREGLKDVPGMQQPTIGSNRSHVYHQYTVRILPEFPLSRDAFVAAMRDRGVGVGVYYPKPLHAFPHIARIGYVMGDFPVAEQAAEQVVSLPVHPQVSEADIDTIITAIKELANASGK